MSSWDSPNFIAAGLGTLADLHALAAGRHLAAQRGEKLSSWLVLGRYLLDEHGQLLCVVLRLGRERVAPESLAQVVSVAELKRVFAAWHTNAWHARIPTPTETCAECGQRFSIESARYAKSRGDRGFMHVDCARIDLERSALASFRDIFAAAGLGRAVLQPIPNEYWPESDGCDDDTPYSPWVLAKTHYGTIKMGSRKRVDHIEWSDVVSRLERGKGYDERRAMRDRLSAESLFPSEKSTKGDAYIHAWSDEKAIEYLRAIDKAIRAELGRDV